MTGTFILAHLSDVHLGPVTGFAPRHWNAKRTLGYLNWQRTRRHVHRRDIAERIVADAKNHHPDHIAVTGDLINIGLPTEYEAAGSWLGELGTPDAVSVVPGNHDIYTTLRRDPGIERWRSFMRDDDSHPPQADAPAFPYLRRRGPVAIIGMCSAIETPPAVAIGRVGAAQLAAAAALLDTVESDRLRVVLIHHPPLPGMTRPRHELVDAAAVGAALARAGADLVLHGHTHLPTLVRQAGAGRPMFVVGVGSASAGQRRGHEPLAQYNLIAATPTTDGWTLELRRRGLEAPDGPVTEIEHLRLA